MQKALLFALLQPNGRLTALQDAGDFTQLMVAQEELKTAPFGEVWDEYCRRCGKPGDGEWFPAVKAYEKKILEVSLIENIQREDLNPMEEAQAFRELMDKYGLTQEEVSVRVSKSRSAIANSLRLLRIDDRVQQMLKEGKISMGHARALLALDSKEHQFEIAQEIESKQLSVRETEKLVRQLLKKKKERTRTVDEEEKKLQIIYRSLEEQLCQKLVGKIRIAFRQNACELFALRLDELHGVVDRF